MAQVMQGSTFLEPIRKYLFDNSLEVVVHTADIQDRDCAKLVLEKLSQKTKTSLLKLWADGGYAGKLI